MLVMNLIYFFQGFKDTLNHIMNLMQKYFLLDCLSSLVFLYQPKFQECL